MSPWQERITAMSSMHSRECAGTGRRPRCRSCRSCLNVRLVPSSLASLVMNWYFASPNSAGRFWPLSLFSSGLGSKVSRWLGPPAMNRKITDLALALSGMCGGLGASGFMRSRRAALPAAAWRAKASAPKPQKASRRNSRRLRVMRICSGMRPLVHVQKCIQVEHRQRELPPAVASSRNCQRQLHLFRRRRRGPATRR